MTVGTSGEECCDIWALQVQGALDSAVVSIAPQSQVEHLSTNTTVTILGGGGSEESLGWPDSLHSSAGYCF